MSAKRAVEHMRALSEKSDDPINLIISSPGGHVESGDMLHDMINFIKPKVRCIGRGWGVSAGALIFIGVALKNRYCLPNTRFFLHQPSGGIGGQASDMKIQEEQRRQMRSRFEGSFAAATGHTPQKIVQDTKRDFWLKVEAATSYGLVGQIVSSYDALE